jgi:hypothetical protein
MAGAYRARARRAFRSAALQYSSMDVLRSRVVKSLRLFTCAALAGAVFLGVPRSASALTYTPQTPLTVARDAAYVVIATVAVLEPAYTPEGAEIDWLTLDVHEQWRGPRAQRLRVRQVRTVQDAETGARAMFAGNFALEQGRTYLLFLPAETELPTVPLTVAGESGAYKALRTATGWSFSTLGGQTVLDVTAERWLLDAPGDPRVVYMNGAAPPPKPARRLDLAVRWRALVARVTGR